MERGRMRNRRIWGRKPLKQVARSMEKFGKKKKETEEEVGKHRR